MNTDIYKMKEVYSYGKYLLGLALILTLEQFHRQPLYDWSLPLIISMQKSSLQSINFLFTTASAVTEIENFYLAFLVAYAFKSPQQGLYYLSFISTIWVVKNFGKLAYHDPRPYMSHDLIQAVGCEREFGNPSGHSTQSAAITVFLALELCEGGGQLVSGLMLAGGVFGLVGFSRVYQGLHSVNQVIFGYQLGIWLAIFFHYKLKAVIIESKREALKWYAAVCSIGFAVQVITFYWVHLTFEIDPEWTRRIESKCGDMGENIYKTYEYKSFVNAGVCFMPLFAIIGCRYSSVNVFAESTKEKLLKLIASGIMMIPGVVVHKIFTVNKFNYNGVLNAWIILMGRTIIPSVLIGSLVFRWTNSLYCVFKQSKPRKVDQAEPLLPLNVAIN
ncbi:hypothetical protein FGO68_gene445 [Halteria grandinella]|uniref:Phosphatidic acid phosphatase type 2/haloperoxidase domain-containing protein n=1 Tax=Halteria grandinella TaxID=5974 RepID=A0A8J8T0C0_HALGN|nr:hypothetical protein FGO68_gene445 [Halteria grandinella]